MLSGIKFVPREQLDSTSSDSDGSEKERKDSKKERKEKGKKKGKKRRSRREYSSDDRSYSDESGSGSGRSQESKEERRSKRRGRRRRREDSYSSSSSSDEYEKRRGGKKKKKIVGKESRKKRNEGKEFSDDDGKDSFLQNEKEQARREMGLEWMLAGSGTKNNTAKVVSEPEEPKAEEVKKVNPRELNPYLRDDGSGYPDEEPASGAGGSQLLSSSVVGDGGASWRLKALKRAKEQAAREGRKLDDVIEERWDSLGHLAASVAARRVAPVHAHLHAIKDRKRGQIEKTEADACDEVKESTDNVRNGSRDYLRGVSSRHPEMRKPKQDSLHWKKNRRHNISSEDNSLISSALSGLNKFANDGSYMDSISCLQKKDAGASNSSHADKEPNDRREHDMDFSKVRNSNEVSSVSVQGLSANQLAARILQLRMKGKHEEAEKLSKEMEAMIDKPDMGNKTVRQESEGNTSRYIEREISRERKKTEDDADLHLAQKIMQNKQYSMSGRADDEYDFDGDASSRKRNRKREAMHNENKVIPKRMLTQQERCQFCFENPSRPKHLVVSIGNFTYMMLPPWQPVVQGHCCILPMQHDSATRTVDKNVWEELRNFKKCLLRMFAGQDKDVVFLETVIGLARQRRHCLIECIPVPYEVGKEAPMYFKKAIDEAEDEWGQHEMKKVIPTSGNLRHVIPENLSYFHVEFGLDKGFVHVIDDDANFTNSFGLNIIRGMLQLPEEDMHRRRRHEPADKQKQAVSVFAKDWEPFDWTKGLD